MNKEESKWPDGNTKEGPDWFGEFCFWSRKFNRAYIRYSAALDSGNKSKSKIAWKQMEFYKRRMDSVIPEEVKERNRKYNEAERRAALNDE